MLESPKRFYPMFMLSLHHQFTGVKSYIVPNGVDPHPSRIVKMFLGLGLHVTALAFEILCAQSKIISHTPIEASRQSSRGNAPRIIGSLNILMAPCQLPHVKSHADIETAIP